MDSRQGGNVGVLKDRLQTVGWPNKTSSAAVGALQSEGHRELGMNGDWWTVGQSQSVRDRGGMTGWMNGR